MTKAAPSRPPARESMAEKQRAFRAKHKPDRPPYVGIWLREGDAICLAAGVIPDSLRQTAVEAVQEFWSEEPETTEKLSRAAGRS